MSGNFAIKGGGGGRLMANAILNFHFDFLNPSLIGILRVPSVPVNINRNEMTFRWKSLLQFQIW